MHSESKNALNEVNDDQLELFSVVDQTISDIRVFRVEDHLKPSEVPDSLARRLPLLNHFADRIWSVSRPVFGSSNIRHLTFVRTFWEFDNADVIFFLMRDGRVRTKKWVEKEPRVAENYHAIERLVSKEAHPDLILCLAEHFAKLSTPADNLGVDDALQEIRRRNVRRLRSIKAMASKIQSNSAEEAALQQEVAVALHRHAALHAAEAQNLRSWLDYHLALLESAAVEGATKRRVFSLAAYNALASVGNSSRRYLAQVVNQNYALVTACLAAAQQPRMRHRYLPHWVESTFATLALATGTSLRKRMATTVPTKKSVMKYLAGLAIEELGTRSIDRLSSYLDTIPHAHWPPAYRVKSALLLAQEARTFEMMLSEFCQRDLIAESVLGSALKDGLKQEAAYMFRQRWSMSVHDRRIIGLYGRPRESGQLKNESFAQRFLFSITSAGLAYEAVIGILTRVCRMPALSRCQLFKAVDALASNEQKNIGECVMGFDMFQDFFGDIESVYRNAQADMEPEQKFPTPHAGGSFWSGAGMYAVKPVSAPTDLQAVALEFANCLGRDEEFSKVALLQVSLWVIRKKHPIESTQSSMAEKSILALQIDTTADEAGQKQHKFVLTQIHGPRNCAVTPEHSEVADQLITLLNQEPEKARRFLKAKLEVQLKFLHWMRTSAAEFSRCQLIRLIKNYRAYPLCTTKDG